MTARILHLLTWPIWVPTLKVFAGFKIVGKKNLKNIRGPVIFVSNHTCLFDPFILGAGIPLTSFNLYPIYYLANFNNYKRKLTKPVTLLYGAFPGKVERGIEEAIKKPTELLKKGKTIGVFPEWCYKVEPEISRARKIIAILSIKNNVPVIPVFIYGIYDGGISWKTIFGKKRDIKLIFGKPLYPPSKDISVEKMQDLVYKAFMDTKIALVESFHDDEKKFWNNYASFYHYLERADPHKDLVAELDKNIPESIRGRWIDLGSGSGAIAEILSRKMMDGELFATDFDKTMINHLSKRFSDNKKVKIKSVDLSLALDFPDNYFNGVTANLVLPYIIHHRGKIGQKGFANLLEEIYRVLKPGGKFVWSTPKKKVNFFKVFWASKRNILDNKNMEHLYYGLAILRQALRIQKKGRQEIYHFLDIEELKKILEDIGFVNIKLGRSMANQVDLISCEKKL